MWLSLIPVFGLFALCAGYSSVKSSDPVNNAGSTLDSVNLSVERLRERQRAQERAIRQLLDSSGDNQALEYEFNEVVLDDVNNEISVQNRRLGVLKERIAQIRGLKSEIGNLRNQAYTIEVLVNKTDARDIYTLDRLNALAENDFQEGQEIIDLAIEANTLRQGLEQTVNTVDTFGGRVNVLVLRTAQLITSLDFTSVAAFERNLTLTNGVAEANIAYPRFPRNVGVYSTGFDLTRNGSKYDSDGTARLAFDVEAVFGTNLIEVDAYDLSTNGWYTNSVSVSVIGATYYDRRLDIRAPFESPQ